MASFGLADRLRFYPGDFFVDPLPSADVLVMGHILHDWSLEEKLMLLRKAHQALPDKGALIVYESIIDDERRTNTFGMLMSVNMSTIALSRRAVIRFSRSWFGDVLVDAGLL